MLRTKSQQASSSSSEGANQARERLARPAQESTSCSEFTTGDHTMSRLGSCAIAALTFLLIIETEIRGQSPENSASRPSKSADLRAGKSIKDASRAPSAQATGPTVPSQPASRSAASATPQNSRTLAARRFPRHLTAYDIMTPEDEFYFHHLDGLCIGDDVSEWPLVDSLVDLGQDIVDANLLANLANETIYVSDQPRARPVVAMVNECAEVLQIDAPAVHIEGNPRPNAYVSGIKEPHVLVLTSGLLDLYEETPEELRFIIGHELGHIKTKHLKTHFIGRTFVDALIGESGKEASFKDQFVAAVVVGTLLHWFRESEYSADRAGLICVGGDVQVAKQALLRLQHQTKPSNKLFDATYPEFDADLVLKNHGRLRGEPFVKVVSYLRQSKSSHPFIPERCAAIGMWAESGEYLALLNRSNKRPADGTLVITSVQIQNIPKVDTYFPLVDSGDADPFAKITSGEKTLVTGRGVDLANPSWSKLDLRMPYSRGAGIVLDLYDYNTALPNKLVGSCLLPISESGGRATARADLRLDTLEASTIDDRTVVTVQYRIEDVKK
jgi:Zn-dependent protease with chaperone function